MLTSFGDTEITPQKVARSADKKAGYAGGLGSGSAIAITPALEPVSASARVDFRKVPVRVLPSHIVKDALHA